MRDAYTLPSLKLTFSFSSGPGGGGGCGRQSTGQHVHERGKHYYLLPNTGTSDTPRRSRPKSFYFCHIFNKQSVSFQFTSHAIGVSRSYCEALRPGELFRGTLCASGRTMNSAGQGVASICRAAAIRDSVNRSTARQTVDKLGRNRCHSTEPAGHIERR
jgi:hypothetical protein